MLHKIKVTILLRVSFDGKFEGLGSLTAQVTTSLGRGAILGRGGQVSAAVDFKRHRLCICLLACNLARRGGRGEGDVVTRITPEGMGEVCGTGSDSF